LYAHINNKRKKKKKKKETILRDSQGSDESLGTEDGGRGDEVFLTWKFSLIANSEGPACDGYLEE
jgi:hypothetical protein